LRCLVRCGKEEEDDEERGMGSDVTEIQDMMLIFL